VSTAGHRPLTLRFLSLVSCTAHRVTGGRIGAADPGEQAPRGRALALITGLHRSLYRWTGGLIGGNAGGLATLLLTTTGRKTGKARTVPLPYFRDGDHYVVIASNSGQEKNPAWLDNLVATPEVGLQVRFTTLRARATVASGAERERIWKAVVAIAPMYADYQRVTAREIPAVVLTPLP
jgi:deazaflavin-dependent oxidoreductase (nitroreductase family)